MFQKLNYFIALFVVLFALQSCQKEALTTVPTPITTAVETQEIPIQFEVTIDNGLLSFPTTEDYENAIEYLHDYDKEALAEWNASIGFSSLQSYYNTNEISEENREVAEETFASLLNPDRMIKIGQNIIMVDMAEESNYVLIGGNTAQIKDLKKKSLNNKSIQSYSNEVNVLDILGGDDSSLFQKASYCDSNSTEWVPAGYCNPNILEYRLRYFKAGIYYSLKATYKGNSGGCQELKLVNLVNGFAENRKETITFSPITAIGSGSSVSNKPYSSAKRLKSYSMHCNFQLLDDDGYLQDLGNRTITCD